MNENNTFNPLAWASMVPASSSENTNVQSVNNAGMSTADNELQKVRAVCKELLARAANIADDENDYFHLLEAMADLGDDGKELCRSLCQQSAKYEEPDFEKKWRWAMNNSRRTIHIATFYEMAKQNGVDLSAISRQFPSNPSNPQVSPGNDSMGATTNGSQSYSIHNQNNNKNCNSSLSPASVSQGKSEGMREVRESFSDTFSDKIDAGAYPELLRRAADTQESLEDKDKITLGSLVTVSGAMPGVQGIYGGKRLAPPLYLIFGAPSGTAEKGMINDCRQWLMPIEYAMRHEYEQAQAEYEEEKARFEAMKPKERAQQKKPVEPTRQTVFIPANSSATAVYQELADNGGMSVFFETEADTLTQALQQDYGNYSDGLRKAFHHETICYSRRTEKEYVYVDKPKLAVLLTCTPGQIPLLLPSGNVENGLANRFVYYLMRGFHGWKDPWASQDEPLEDRLYAIGKDYQKLYLQLLKRKNSPLEFTLTQEQRAEFNAFFAPLYHDQIKLYGESIDAFVFRLGVTTFRLAMVLTVLRCFEHPEDLAAEQKVLVCRNEDFQTAKTIANTLINHTAYVYDNLLEHNAVENPQVAAMLSQEQQLYAALSDDFTTQDYQTAARSLGIAESTAERYVGKFCTKYMVARRVRNGLYNKLRK